MHSTQETGIMRAGEHPQTPLLVQEVNYGHGWAPEGQLRERAGSYHYGLAIHIFNRIDARWQGLRNSLAGLFCASLGALDAVRTTAPAATFPPEGSLPFWPGTPVNGTTTITTNGAHEIRHASLPAEHVCTENLTPFLNCFHANRSLGSLRCLNPHRLFGADWHGLGVHVRWVADAGVEVRLIFQGVFKPSTRARGPRQKRVSTATLHVCICQFSC